MHSPIVSAFYNYLFNDWLQKTIVDILLVSLYCLAICFPFLLGRCQFSKFWTVVYALKTACQNVVANNCSNIQKRNMTKIYCRNHPRVTDIQLHMGDHISGSWNDNSDSYTAVHIHRHGYNLISWYHCLSWSVNLHLSIVMQKLFRNLENTVSYGCITEFKISS